jgi:hypothetical protein
LNKNSYSNLIFTFFPHDAGPRQENPAYRPPHPSTKIIKTEGKFAPLVKGAVD